eukprot:374128_1
MEGALLPSTGGAIKKGGFIQIKGHPCKCVDVTTSKTGKHGHAKAKITGIDIFTQKKYELVESTTHAVYVPDVKKEEVEVINVSLDAGGEIDAENVDMIADETLIVEYMDDA